MTFPFPFVTMGGTFAPPAATASYTLVHLANSDDTSPQTYVDWDATVVDHLSCHSNSVEPSKFTIPVAINGRYGRLTCNFDAPAIHQALFHKNGANFIGSGRLDLVTEVGNDRMGCVSAPVLLSTGDYYQFTAVSAVEQIDPNDGTWYQLELLPSSFSGALVYPSGTQAWGSGVSAPVAFDSEQYDVGGWHDNVTNNSRLTVPTGVSLVRVSGGALTSSANSQLILTLTKNGANNYGMPSIEEDTTGAESLSIMSAPMACTPGDYFELLLFYGASMTLQSDNTWFAIEELDPALKYAIVRNSAVQAIPGASALTTVNWDTEVVDTDGWHDNVTNNSRLTVPSGVTHVRVLFSAQGATQSGQWGAEIKMNGASFLGAGVADTDTAGVDTICGQSAIIEVVPGDYFELQVYSANARNLNATAVTWFAIEECPNHT